MRTAIAPRQAAEIRSASEMVALVEAVLRFKPVGAGAFLNSENKKADVVEHPGVFHHVGLLANEPPRHGRVALYLVIRQFRSKVAIKRCCGSFSALIVRCYAVKAIGRLPSGTRVHFSE